MHRMLGLFVFLAVSFGGAACADVLPPPRLPSNQDWGSIEGTIVRQESGKPAQSVTVEIEPRGTPPGVPLDRVYADQTGFYRVPTLPAGEYRLRIPNGRSVYVHPTPVRVVDHENTKVNIVLPPAPPETPQQPIVFGPGPNGASQNATDSRASWLRCKITSSVGEGDGVVLNIDKGRIDRVKVGQKGIILIFVYGEYLPLPGGDFTIVKVESGTSSVARVSGLRSLGKTAGCLINNLPH